MRLYFPFLAPLFILSYAAFGDVEVENQEDPGTAEFQRIDCIPEAVGGVDKVTVEVCNSRGCRYQPPNSSLVPVCFFPPENGYRITNQTTTPKGTTILAARVGAFPFQGGINNIAIDIEEKADHLLRIKIRDATADRYEVPVSLNLPSGRAPGPMYTVSITNQNPLSFKVIRKSTGTAIWDTSVGGLVISEQFLQIATRLPSVNVYGFGENQHHSLRHDLNFTSWPMFARDQPPAWERNSNLYGVHPFYTVVEDDGNSHAVFIRNSNAQEYSFTPTPMLTYRTVGGILDIYFFFGPEPETVMQQYHSVIGKPYMPPYWALGFQQSRYGYKDVNDVKGAVDRTRNAGIPLDVQYVDIDYMDERKDFTVDPVHFGNLSEYFSQLRASGMRTIVILDPCFVSNLTGYEPYDRVKAVNGTIRWPADFVPPKDSSDSRNSLLGYVWPKGKVVFPDFFQPKTQEIWKDLIVKFRDQIPFDGIWIDMNEPASFGTNEEKPFNWPDKDTPYWSLTCGFNNWDSPPYRPLAASIHDNPGNPDVEGQRTKLSAKTVCMNTVQGANGEYKHYNVHNLFGWSQTKPTLEAARTATKSRSVVISRSTFPGSGKYTGHWLGDNESSWAQLAYSIIGALEFNLFGIPYIGADICGFMLNTTSELCTRWMQLGAFYTFSRNHNGIGFINQDPGSLGNYVASMSQRAMTARYLLLPYLYTLFHKANQHGGTVMRPLHHEFPRDRISLGIDRQFMWGSALLISPILEKGQTKLSMYFPQGRWFDFYTGAMVSEGGEKVTVPVGPQSHIPLHFRGGHVIPFQNAARNTQESRKGPVQLMVILDNEGVAKGDLFWDDGESIDTYESGQYLYTTFVVRNNQLSVSVYHDGLPNDQKLSIGRATVCGVRSSAVREVRLNGVPLDKESYSYDISTQVLFISFNVSMEQNTTITWTLSDGSENVDCLPDIINRTTKFSDQAKVTCQSRGCAWSTDNLNLLASPSPCFMSSEQGYEWIGAEDIPGGYRYHLKKMGSSTMFGGDFSNIYLDVQSYSNDIIGLRFDTPDDDRYKVPLDLNFPDIEIENKRYMFKITNHRPFSFQLIRQSTGTVLWDTGVGGLVFADQFLQISTRLPSNNMYGFGENVHLSLRHDLNYQRWGLFARDQPPGQGANFNLYGVHPFYQCVENDGNAHGVLLLNSNAQDYSLTPLPMLTYRTIGGILDFYFFLGPNPESVVQQYTGVIGRPLMPPYWSLGFQLSRYNYTGTDDVRATVERNRVAGIPHDVQYVDIDYMDRRMDFTVDDNGHFAGLDPYFRELQRDGMRTIIILDPCIITNVTGYEPYQKFKQAGANVKWPSGITPPVGSVDDDGSVLGYVWPKGKVIFPDFFQNATGQTWIDLITKFRDTLTFDGIWIDMNEPANFGTNDDRPFNWPEDEKPYWSLKCEGNKYDNPPYKTMATYIHDAPDRKATFPDKTMCMTLRQGAKSQYRHYDVHNLYGWSQTPSTLEGARRATGERSVVISRSTFPGSGKFTGHWLGDNDSSWSQLRASVIGILEFNLFGIPYIGADICGFLEIATKELCLRWMQLGAFYTFSRNHNGELNPPQDPAAYDVEMQKASREVLTTKYTFLPYLYTLFYNAHVYGSTVIRPVHHEFPSDPHSWDVSYQFMWGPALLICPIVFQGQTELNIYLPPSRWYDFYTGEVVSVNGGGNITRPIELTSKIPLFMRGGYISPGQYSSNNTHYSRKNNLFLNVYLDGYDDDGGTATGELFWDDGISIDTIENYNYYYSKFYCQQKSLEMWVQQGSLYVTGLSFDAIHVAGINSTVDQVTVHSTSGGSRKVDFQQNVHNKTLHIYPGNLNLREDFRIQWDHVKRSSPQTGREVRQVDIVNALKIDCIPDNDKHPGSLEQECQRRQCIWNPVTNNYNAPACYIDNSKYGYTLTKATTRANGNMRFDLRKRSSATMFGDDSDVLLVDFEQWTDSTFRINIHDPNNPYRYQVPVPLNKPTTGVKQPLYSLKYGTTDTGFFYLQVVRKSSKTVLWDTSVGGLIFSEQFLQLSTKLASSDIYGFGENRHFSFRHSTDYKEWPMFARDESPGSPDFANLYGVHPFYTSVEDEIGNTHGVLLLNSNAQEYVFRPVPSLTYRTTGGILDFYFFMGPQPESVVQQYTEVVGRPYMPPYWALGFQLCRWGYRTLDKMKQVHDRMIAAKIPYDVQYADIDYMDERKDFTYDKINFNGLPEFVKAIHKEGRKFIFILDPGLVSNYTGYRPYDIGRQKDIFIKWPKGTSPDFNDHHNDDMLGYVWPRGKTVFPDFLNPNGRDVWQQLIREMHSVLPFDGLWIDMNEPSNFGTNQERPMNWPEKDWPYWSLKCPQSKWDDPPYKPRSIFGDRLSDKTLCMVGLQNDGIKAYRHYDVHSLYGWAETMATSIALENVTNKRSVVISRSSFPGSGKHGFHWLGDNASKWSHLKDSVIGILEFNLFGIPYVGADICGFGGNSNAELCQRWMQLGAFYTLSRNHNDENSRDQDPAAFGAEVAASSRKALETRYELLPYLYTLFFRAHVDGNTVIRAMLHEFPHDSHARGVDTQFLWGPAFLVAPVLEQGKTTKDVYFPADVWYEYESGRRVELTGQTRTVSAPRDFIPLFVRGGYILPTQQPALNTHLSQKNPMGLLIATDAAGSANGELYLDDGESLNNAEKGQYWLIKFIFKEYNKASISMAKIMVEECKDLLNVLHVTHPHGFNNYNLPNFDKIRLLGRHKAPTAIYRDGEIVPTQDYHYYSGSGVLEIHNLGLSYGTNFTITIH